MEKGAVEALVGGGHQGGLTEEGMVTQFEGVVTRLEGAVTRLEGVLGGSRGEVAWRGK